MEPPWKAYKARLLDALEALGPGATGEKLQALLRRQLRLSRDWVAALAADEKFVAGTTWLNNQFFSAVQTKVVGLLARQRQDLAAFQAAAGKWKDFLLGLQGLFVVEAAGNYFGSFEKLPTAALEAFCQEVANEFVDEFHRKEIRDLKAKLEEDD